MARSNKTGGGFVPTVPTEGGASAPKKAPAPASETKGGKPAAMRWFVCTSASSTILHPHTGVLILRGRKGERKQAPVGSELYDILRSREDWDQEGHPRFEGVESKSFRTLGDSVTVEG